MGRGVETAFLSLIIEQLRQEGVQVVRGLYIPTAKNEPVKHFYQTHGFTHVDTLAGGEELWSADLNKYSLACPPWIRLRSLTQRL